MSFLLSIGPDHKSSYKVRAKKCDLNHCGVIRSMTSKNGRCKRKLWVKEQLKETLGQVVLVKNDQPIPKDVVKASANVSGNNISYYQGYHAIKAKDAINLVTDLESYEPFVP
jgi:hypothetical protein